MGWIAELFLLNAISNAHPGTMAGEFDPVFVAPGAPGSTAGSPRLSVEAAREAFTAAPGYLAACTMGLPTRQTLAALRDDLDLWQAAGTSPSRYDESVARARAAYARLVSVHVDRVAIGSQVSVLASVVASSVPDGAEVVCVTGDFSSMVYPFAAHAHRGVTVRNVPLERLAESIDARTWLVAFSLVQSATGRVADAASIIEAAQRNGTRTLCDTTQATGWLTVDAGRFDATICHAYKWLCSPRGTAFLTVSAGFATQLNAVQAGWYAGEDPWHSCYGPQMALAASARRFDVSPAWQAWVGTAPALELFAELEPAAVTGYDTALGNALCDALGVPARDQAIVTWPDADGSDLRALTAAGIVASGRAGNARVAFHLWNDVNDVEAVLRALRR
jgi:selenocysteine lyase/cysteine desulfurase